MNKAAASANLQTAPQGYQCQHFAVCEEGTHVAAAAGTRNHDWS
jgi:hypothetical protein